MEEFWRQKKWGRLIIGFVVLLVVITGESVVSELASGYVSGANPPGDQRRVKLGNLPSRDDLISRWRDGHSSYVMPVYVRWSDLSHVEECKHLVPLDGAENADPEVRGLVANLEYEEVMEILGYIREIYGEDVGVRLPNQDEVIAAPVLENLLHAEFISIPVESTLAIILCKKGPLHWTSEVRKDEAGGDQTGGNVYFRMVFYKK